MSEETWMSAKGLKKNGIEPFRNLVWTDEINKSKREEGLIYANSHVMAHSVRRRRGRMIGSIE